MSSPLVFQTSLAFERRWATDVVRAVLSTVLFHRALGGFQPTTLEVCGVTFSAPAAADVDAIIAAKTDLICRALLLGSAASSATRKSKRVRLYISLYPTPLPVLPPPARARQRTGGGGSYAPIQRAPSPATVAAGPTPVSAALPDTTTAYSSSPSRSSRRASAAAIAQAAPAAVTSALGWFSASARAALIGAGTSTGGAGQDDPTASATSHADAAIMEEQEPEIRLVEHVKAQGKKPFEGWMIEFEALPDGHNERNRRPSSSDDKLRAQLNDFLLRVLDFTLRQTAHIPPITTTDLMPYGILMLVDPPIEPFQVPKPIVEQVVSFPDLHRTLVSAAQDKRTNEGGGQRAASVGGRW
ncbi:hypothetical protein C6P46_005820 [Rhodotorula mucilaginosa]|uniref:Autophagy-related protein 101 n=1 Tax=Rhodotorula mucilaginosa TaxID=5537 RepID=A0A9P6VY06_RHOMI|nr:hypothetical protein C6P46_005820 [Rhodotorula mucilaginosa]